MEKKQGFSSFQSNLVIPEEITTLLESRLQKELKGNPYDRLQFDSVTEEAAEIVDRTLPASLKGRITQVMTSNIGFISLAGTPQDPNLMDTPVRDGLIEKRKKTFVTEAFSMAIAHLLGLEIFNYAQEGWGQGKLIFNVFPLKNLIDIKGAGGTENDFGFHTENAWHPLPIESVMLTGLRQDHEGVAETYAVPTQRIVSALTEDEISILSRELFIISPPEIHRRMEEEKGIPFAASNDYVGPVLTWSWEGYPQMRINFNGMRPESSDSSHYAALERVEKIAKSLCTSIRLSGDNMIIIKNSLAIHTRNGYTPRFDGKDRWFQRYFLAKPTTLWKEQAVTSKDFSSFLDAKEAEILVRSFKKNGLCEAGGRLTPAFRPYDPSFDLKLPKDFEEKKVDILKSLILKGPVKPNRMV